MDGIAATQKIRELSSIKAAEIPIIAMTANVFSTAIDECLAAGMNDYLSKPLDLKLLKEMLADYLKTP
jgi:CheY-like chemotaxis protein